MQKQPKKESALKAPIAFSYLTDWFIRRVTLIEIHFSEILDQKIFSQNKKTL
jgi:hypothetical protein